MLETEEETEDGRSGEGKHEERERERGDTGDGEGMGGGKGGSFSVMYGKAVVGLGEHIFVCLLCLCPASSFGIDAMYFEMGERGRKGVKGWGGVLGGGGLKWACCLLLRTRCRSWWLAFLFAGMRLFVQCFFFFARSTVIPREGEGVWCGVVWCVEFQGLTKNHRLNDRSKEGTNEGHKSNPLGRPVRSPPHPSPLDRRPCRRRLQQGWKEPIMVCPSVE